MVSLDGRVAIITGCGRGFGEAMARLFSREGAKVSICDIIPLPELEKVSSRIKAVGGDVLCFKADVSEEEQVKAMVEGTLDRFGAIDILVNNVGIAGPTKDCWEITMEEWNSTLAVNLGGTFLCSRAVLPEMIRKRWGRIINISSITGKTPLPQRTPYATSKMGIIGFTRTLAAEVGRYNITVNCICPGNPGGERNVEIARERARYLGRHFDKDEYLDRMEERRRQGVLGGQYLSHEGLFGALITHEDVASMALFLASEEAGRITGQDINVDGGAAMW